MSYASIMVAVDQTDHAAARVRLAGHLADTFSARLIGLTAGNPALIVPLTGPVPANLVNVAAAHELFQKDIQRLRTAFFDAAGHRSRIEWFADNAFPVPFLLDYAGIADLIVVGSREAHDCQNSRFIVDPSEAVMRLGRPMLVAPPSLDYIEAKNVAIGWKNTPEARRAVWDALPFLRQATQIYVISIDEGHGACDSHQVLRYLDAHGLYAYRVQGKTSELSTSGTLVETARDCGADLLVTGAYGYSRVREWCFGGVTHELLRGTPLCCLMSH